MRENTSFKQVIITGTISTAHVAGLIMIMDGINCGELRFLVRLKYFFGDFAGII